MENRLKDRQRSLHGDQAMATRKRHDLVFIALVVVILALFIFITVSTVYLQKNGYLEDGPFIPANHGTTEIVPAKWTYTIWIPIYFWQAAGIIYAISCIFRRNEDGPVYINPQVLSYVFFITYALSMLILCGWVFIDTTTGNAVWSLLCRLCLQITLYVVMVTYYIRIKVYCKCITRRHRCDIFLLRLLIQNGIALYTTWCSVATLLGFTTVMVSTSQMTQEAAASFSLFILSLEMIIFFIFDVIVFDRYTRYTFTTYPTVIWALLGILARNYERERKHMVLAVALVTIISTMFTIKLTVAIKRRRTDPLDFDTLKKKRTPRL